MPEPSVNVIPLKSPSGVFIRQAELEDGARVDIRMRGEKITEVATCLVPEPTEQVIDGRGCLALPPFYNFHTHAGLTLLHGAGEDLALMDWLRDYIWPAEKNFSEEYVYAAARLACLQMIKTGTVYFLDMGLFPEALFQAAEDMGVRATICPTVFDHFAAAAREREMEHTSHALNLLSGRSSRVNVGMGPHAIYTVSGEFYKWAGKLARGGITLHTHLAETAEEHARCVKKTGMSPVRYLWELGALTPSTVLAHCCYVEEEDIQLIAQSGAKVVTNPISNMKLANGRIFPYVKFRQAGVPVFLGTDGAVSNNSLDMLEETKFFALAQKHLNADPTAVTAAEALRIATRAPARALGLTPEITPGGTADIMLVDTTSCRACPENSSIPTLVYALNGDAVRTVICAGKVLMENRDVPGEKDILEAAREASNELKIDTAIPWDGKERTLSRTLSRT